jgi:hypothetical protein
MIPTNGPNGTERGRHAHLLGSGADLRGHQLLEVADRVVGLALYAHLLAESVVAVFFFVSLMLCGGGGGERGLPDNFNHIGWGG